MSRLSDCQLVVLTAACKRQGRCVFPVTSKLKGNAAGNVLKSLLKRDLIKEVRAKRDDTVWRHEEERGPMTLVATKAAFAALGINVAEDPEGFIEYWQAERSTCCLQGRRQAVRNRKAIWNFPVRCQEGTRPGNAPRP